MRRTRARRGFTLMELLVVMGIIILMTAMSLPAISKFLDGQQLQQSGRIMQSAFNEARRAAVTQRTENYLLFFREMDPATQETKWGVQRYRKGFGYEGPPHLLLPNVQFGLQAGSGTTTGGPEIAGRLEGSGLPVFSRVPPENDGALFDTSRREVKFTGVLKFLKDGTITIVTPVGAAPMGWSLTPPPDLFDLNIPTNFAVGQFDALSTGVDFNLRETGDREVDRRCFCDIDPNTGRLVIRVVQPTE